MTKVNHTDISRLIVEWGDTIFKTPTGEWCEREGIEYAAFRTLVLDMVGGHAMRMKETIGTPALARPSDIVALVEVAILFGYEMHKQFKGSSNEL